VIPIPSFVLRAALALAAVGALWFAGHRYLEQVEQRGYDRAVAEGLKQHAKDMAKAQEETESLRAAMRDQDERRYQENQRHEAQIADLERRARAGAVRLFCPAASTVSATAASEDRPAAAGRGTEEGQPLVPDAAADVLRIGAGIARDVRDYNDLLQRYEACRAIADTGEFKP